MIKQILLFITLAISIPCISQIVDTNTVIEYNIFSNSIFKQNLNKSTNGVACTAEVIDQCGVSFNTTNYGESNSGNGVGDIICTGIQIGASCILGSWVPIYNDLDNNLSTGNANGGDVGYSVENDIYYTFCQASLDTYTITIIPSNCNTVDGFQYAVFEGLDCNNFGNGLLAGGLAGQNWLTTQTFTITPTNVNNCIFIQIDGFAGTECDFGVTVTPTNTCTVLPIELIDFSGYNKNGINNLSWITVSEMNNDYFILERSIDGISWLNIGKVKASGNSTQLIKYDFYDNDYRNITNYYRLIQVDFDGKFEVFKYISIDNTSKSNLIIKTYNLMGQEVNFNYSGIVIVLFGDGTTQRRFNN